MYCLWSDIFCNIYCMFFVCFIHFQRRSPLSGLFQQSFLVLFRLSLVFVFVLFSFFLIFWDVAIDKISNYPNWHVLLLYLFISYQNSFSILVSNFDCLVCTSITLCDLKASRDFLRNCQGFVLHARVHMANIIDFKNHN